MPRFSNGPFLATTLSFLSSRAKRADLRCAIRVPRSYRPTNSINRHRILMKTPTSPFSFRVSGSDPRNRRSFHGTPGQVGFAPPDFLLRLVALWAGRSGAHEWRTADPLASLGMTKRRGSLQGKGRVARKGRLLNRGIFQIEFGQLLRSAVPAGLIHSGTPSGRKR
jgi:hypothetical protein